MATTNKHGINGKQIKLIHTLCGVLAIDDDTYRAMLANRFKVSSCKELSDVQAEALIADLEQKAVAAGVWEKRNCRVGTSSKGKYQGKKFADLEERGGNMATPAQLRKIEAQWSEVSRAVTPEERKKALRHFLERVAKTSDLRFLDMAGATKVINALTAMQKASDKPTKNLKAI